MTTQFTTHLLKWYKKNARSLPWRETKDPYKIWISEIMLQQTTVQTVIPYYDRWIKVFPEVEDVARAPINKLLKMWQGLGYYRRAKNLHRSAQIIVDQFNGKLPKNKEALKIMPGFGPYTIGAVLSIAFNKPEIAIDANIRRVVMRQLALLGIPDQESDKKVSRYLSENMPSRKCGDFNQALMELGALICKQRNPLCLNCPVKSYCSAYGKGVQEIIPGTIKKEYQNIQVVVGLIRNKNKIFIQQRPKKGLLADLWELPGGKIEKGETRSQALKRELYEELGVKVASSKYLFSVDHSYTFYRVKVFVFDCKLKSLPKTNKKRKWVSLGQMRSYPLPSGTAKVFDKLMLR